MSDCRIVGNKGCTYFSTKDYDKGGSDYLIEIISFSANCGWCRLITHLPSFSGFTFYADQINWCRFAICTFKLRIFDRFFNYTNLISTTPLHGVKNYTLILGLKIPRLKVQIANLHQPRAPRSAPAKKLGKLTASDQGTLCTSFLSLGTTFIRFCLYPTKSTWNDEL